MQEENGYTRSVREQLILAGIDEIKENGMVGFSQRRVAAACHLSCAAPYKCFGSREGLVKAILEYIDEQWELFAKEILVIYDGDACRQLLEISLGYLRFLNANPKFRTVIFYCDENDSGHVPMRPASCVQEVIDRYARETGQSEEEVSQRIFMVYSMIFGATLLPRTEKGKLGLSEREFNMVRASIAHAIQDPLHGVPETGSGK